jgi:hypothetical protein
MVGPIYVTGGKQRDVGSKPREEWNLYEEGVVLRIDPAANTVVRCATYRSPNECVPEGEPSITLEAGCVAGGRMYACTRTEALVFELPSFRVVHRISMPFFNDVHHVRPSLDGNLIVTSTGLDAVFEIDDDGTILREWGVLGESPWERFSRDVDYRFVPTTKPHRSHPNHTFYLGGQLWVTRFAQRDAVCLTGDEARIVVGTEGCHDGDVHGANVYFTTVDGRVVVAGPSPHSPRRSIDLNVVGNPSGSLLGWCRGIAVAGDGLAWIGFTRVRETRVTENLRWARDIVRPKSRNTRVSLYDIERRKLVLDVDLEQHGMNAVFGICVDPGVVSPVWPLGGPNAGTLAATGTNS